MGTIDLVNKLYKDGTQLLSQERYADAEDAFGKVVKIISKENPWYPEVLMNYFCTLTAQKKFKNAEEVGILCLEVLQNRGEKEGSIEIVQARMALGEMYCEQGLFTEAINILEPGIIEGKRGMQLLYYYLAIAYYSVRQYIKAKYYANLAIKNAGSPNQKESLKNNVSHIIEK